MRENKVGLGAERANQHQNGERPKEHRNLSNPPNMLKDFTHREFENPAIPRMGRRFHEIRIDGNANSHNCPIRRRMWPFRD